MAQVPADPRTAYSWQMQQTEQALVTDLQNRIAQFQYTVQDIQARINSRASAFAAAGVSMVNGQLVMNQGAAPI